MTCSVFIRKNRFQQIGKALPFLLSKIFLGNCHYIYPKIINPITKEHAIALPRSQRRFTFITGVIIILLQILEKCDFLIDLSCFKIFCHLLDKEFFFFLFFQTINKAVTKLQASASNKACARFCTLYSYKQPFAYALQNRCPLKIRKIHRKTPVKKSLF